MRRWKKYKHTRKNGIKTISKGLKLTELEPALVEGIERPTRTRTIDLSTREFTMMIEQTMKEKTWLEVGEGIDEVILGAKSVIIKVKPI